MPRHRKHRPILPPWYYTEENLCVQSVIEDAYFARELAAEVGAGRVAACEELLRAGEKSLLDLARVSSKSGRRCAAGARAARKFWEAKSCARRVLG